MNKLENLGVQLAQRAYRDAIKAITTSSHGRQRELFRIGLLALLARELGIPQKKDNPR